MAGSAIVRPAQRIVMGMQALSPAGFRACVSRFDTQLDVRWGEALHQWVVDRTSVIPQNEMEYLQKRKERLERRLRTNPKTRIQLPNGEEDTVSLDTEGLKKLEYLYRQVYEEWISAKRGRRVILFASHLTTEIVDALMLSDIKRYGGYSRFADELEYQEDKLEEARASAFRRENEENHRRVYSILDFLNRKRLTEMDHGERDLKKLLGTKDY